MPQKNPIRIRRMMLVIGCGAISISVLALLLVSLLPGHGFSYQSYAASLSQAALPDSPQITADTSIVKQGSVYRFSPSTIRLHFRGDFTVKNTTSSPQPLLVGGHYAGTITAHSVGTFSTLGTRLGIQIFVYHLGDHPSTRLTVKVDYAVHIVKTSNVYHFVPGAVTIENGDPLSFANDTSQPQALLYGGHYAGTVAAHAVGAIWFPNPAIFHVHLGAHPGTLLKVTVKP